MANLNVSYAEMEQKARSLQGGKEELVSTLNRLKGEVDGLVASGFVTDAASGAFQQMYESFTQGATQTVTALDGISQTLNRIAQTLQETDQQLASGIG